MRKCGARLKGPEKAIGRKVKCRKCDHQFLFQPTDPDDPADDTVVMTSSEATPAQEQLPVPEIPSAARQRVAGLVARHSTPSLFGLFGAAMALAAYWISLTLVGLFVLFHLIWNFTMLTGNRGSLAIMIPVFILILIVSVGVFVMMLKPIRATRTRNVARPIKPNAEPGLTNLINQVADCVGATEPKRVEVDYEFRAYAEPLDTFTDFSGKDLYLRIGLAVLASCKVEHFTVLLATRLGLYSTTFNNRQTLFVRNTLDWLNRSAYEQDSWDGVLKRMLSSEKFRLVNQPVAYFLQLGFFVIVRIPFRFFHLIARTLCRSDLKKQELNADMIAIAIHGEETFRDFLIEHQNLTVAQKSAFNDFVDSVETKYAVNNVFDVMSLKRKYLNEYQLEDVMADIDSGTTRSFASLNSDLERLQAAKNLDLEMDSSESFDHDEPVKDLLKSYPVLATQCTQDLRSYLRRKLSGSSNKQESRSRRKKANELERYIQAAIKEGFKSAN